MAEFDNTQALSEGWYIAECDGSDNGPYQAVADDEQDAFADDDAVIEFIRAKVSEGSAYHLRALEYLKEHNPIEFAVITGGRAAAVEAQARYWAEHGDQ